MLYRFAFLALLVQEGSAQTSTAPTSTSCSAVKSLFKSNSCCGSSGVITDTTGVCPAADVSITYAKMFGKWTPCPTETYYSEYSLENALAPGYKGCVSEDEATPCGWYDYYTYDALGSGCLQTDTLQTAVHIVRGGSPTMTADMLRLTGADIVPTVTFAALPMAYPPGRPYDQSTWPEYAEMKVVAEKFMSYYGSKVDFTNFDAITTYGAEQGMNAMIASKVLELASTTCNRQFYAYMKAPAYGYDLGTSMSWTNMRASSFFDDPSCPCWGSSPSNNTCKSPTASLSYVGWAPGRLPDLPSKEDFEGTMYTPDSTALNSPWIQFNVIPGNPIGRYEACFVPADRCMCDGVYWYPGFTAPGTIMRDFKCYAWAFSITKVYSAQMRAGMLFISKTQTNGVSAADGADAPNQIMGRVVHSFANGLLSYMQVHGQIQIMNKIMETPYATTTSWLNAMGQAQREKHDAMFEAYSVCEAAGIMKLVPEYTKYFGAYMLGHMMPDYFGLASNSGSGDLFLAVIGYNHFNYNWGWRGDDPYYYYDSATYASFGAARNLTKLDFTRTHLFRATEVYTEEARRMKLVCTDLNAKVTPSLLSINEWKALREADLAPTSTRRRLGATVATHERALEIQKHVPRMSLINAIKHADLTKETEYKWEPGMPHPGEDAYWAERP